MKYRNLFLSIFCNTLDNIHLSKRSALRTEETAALCETSNKDCLEILFSYISQEELSLLFKGILKKVCQRMAYQSSPQTIIHTEVRRHSNKTVTSKHSETDTFVTWEKHPQSSSTLLLQHKALKCVLKGVLTSPLVRTRLHEN